jgi:hypothetical protein
LNLSKSKQTHFAKSLLKLNNTIPMTEYGNIVNKTKKGFVAGKLKKNIGIHIIKLPIIKITPIMRKIIVASF